MKDQWAIQGNDTMTELVNAIAGPGRVILIGDGWHPIPVCLTRVWCLFEILNTLQLHAVLSFAVFSGNFKKFQERKMTVRQHKWLRKLDSFNLLERPDRFDRGAAAFPVDTASLPIDVRNADATVESDKAMIFDKIEKGVGHDFVNTAVKKAIGDARCLALAAEATVRKQVWMQVLFQASFDVFLWFLSLYALRASGGHGAAVDGEAAPIYYRIIFCAVALLHSLGTLKTAHALVLAKRNAKRGFEQPACAALSTRQRGSFAEIGGSHGMPDTSANLPRSVGDAATVEDEEEVVSRTPSGREALSQPNEPAIFRAGAGQQ